MAKLHNYYVLCPLIDQKSFLGVSQDKDEDCVIVTLGRNVVNKYRLVDQKQLGGWTSKDHITSMVIYDKDQDSYVGVFNNNSIKIWKEDLDNLDKAKKHKFTSNILKLIPRGDQSSLVVFSNGTCATLLYALDNPTTNGSKSLIKETDKIVDIVSYSYKSTDYVCYIIKNKKDEYEIVNCSLRHELGDLERSKLNRVKVSRSEDVSVVGELISVEEKLAVYVLWSDSKMTVYDLVNKTWKTVGTVPWISALNSVSLACMGKNHLILFGSNTDQDGAIIVAYNIVLGVGSYKYPMKMYTEDAKLYCFNGRIILESSNHIGMLPYVLETERNLSSLLGSHDIIQDECTEIADWDTPTTPLYTISDDLEDFLNLGLTERTICSQVIPPLLEKDDFRPLYRLLRQFKDVPESILVSSLNYALKLVNPNNIDVSNNTQFTAYCIGNIESNTDHLIHRAKFEVLNYILQIPFSDALLIPHLRNGMVLNDALFIMSYISFLLVDSDCKLHPDHESKLFDWCTLLMDAFYQQYLMTKDNKVTCVLENMLNVVMNLINQLCVVDSVLPMLNRILNGKMSEDNEDSGLYALELMQI